MPTSAPLSTPFPDIPTQSPDLNSSTYYVSLQTVEYLSPLERGIVAETNRLRENPVAYAEELENLRPYYDGTLLRLPGFPALETTEGVAALDEAIAALRNTEPLESLTPSRGLSQAAQDHVMDLGGIGATGHYGSDGSTPIKRISRYGAVPPGNQVGESISFSPFSLAQWHVIQLVIDDGVPERSHRQALLRREYRLTGVSCGSHAVYNEMCGIIYASNYVEQN